MQTTALILAFSVLAAAPSPQAVQEKERGDRLVANGDLAGAREAYEAAIKLTPGYAAALNELGSLLYRQNDVDGAADAFKKAIASEPSFAQPHYNLGFIHRRKGNWKEAVASYRNFVALEPNDGSGWYGLAESYKGLGDKQNALSAYEQFLAKGSKNEKLLERARAEVETLRKELPAAAATPATVVAGGASAAAPTAVVAGGAVAAAPAATAAVGGVAATASPGVPAAAGGQPVAAPVASVGQPAAAPATSGNQPVAAPVASVGQPAAAPAAIQQVSPEKAELARQRVAEGLRLRSEGKTRESLFALQDAVNADPNNPQAVFELGVAYAMMNYLPQAIERWERILTLPVPEENKVSARENIARARQKLAGVAPTAPSAQPVASAQPAAAPTQPVDSAPQNVVVVPPPMDVAQDAYNQGVRLYTEQKYAEAAAAFGRAIAAKSDFVQAYVGRGSAHLAIRDFNAALADFGQAMRLDNRMASPVFGVAEALVALGREAEAVPYYEAYVASNSADAQQNLKDVAKQRLATIKK